MSRLEFSVPVKRSKNETSPIPGRKRDLLVLNHEAEVSGTDVVFPQGMTAPKGERREVEGGDRVIRQHLEALAALQLLEHLAGPQNRLRTDQAAGIKMGLDAAVDHSTILEPLHVFVSI